MELFRRANLITGWLVFFIAGFVYLSTIEPTASFWDCGEFISSAYKLEVGHPPGAPFFMVMARFFTLFAGNDVMKVAMIANTMSALASDDPLTKQVPGYQAELDYFPIRKFTISIDTVLVRRNGTLSPDDTSELMTEIRWELDIYRKTGYVQNHSFAQRLLFYKTAMDAVKKNIAFGVDTGDV